MPNELDEDLGFSKLLEFYSFGQGSVHLIKKEVK